MVSLSFSIKESGERKFVIRSIMLASIEINAERVIFLLSCFPFSSTLLDKILTIQKLKSYCRSCWPKMKTRILKSFQNCARYENTSEDDFSFFTSKQVSLELSFRSCNCFAVNKKNIRAQVQ